MDFDKFTMKAQEAVQKARQVAIELEHQQIECGHILKGIFLVDEHVLPFIFSKLSIHASNVESALDRLIEGYPKVTGGEHYLSRGADEALNRAHSALKEFGDEFVALEHLFLGILRTRATGGRMLEDAGLNEKEGGG